MAETSTDFNPRSHERSDFVVRHFAFVIAISIHAPTRGATDHTQQCCASHAHFNPRSHERSDEVSTSQKRAVFDISIHAPTRGAT